MKNLVFFLLLYPFLIFSNNPKIPSKIKEVTLYLSGAQITRSAHCNIPSGASEILLTGLSPKIDESSIQLSGLQSVSILSMAYDVNYLVKTESNPETLQWENEIKVLETKIAYLKNSVTGLEEEEKVISTNRLVSSDAQELNLERLKEVGTYYRTRTTQIRNEIFRTNLEIHLLSADIRQLRLQLSEVNDTPEKKQGEIKIKFDAPIAIILNLEVSYTVLDAGWIPSYDLKSKGLNTPLEMDYKANVYQKTGSDWNNVKVILSTGSPNFNIVKPNLGTKYLDFVNGYQKRYSNTIKKQKYVHNPTVKKVTGMITDTDGTPLPGCRVLVKGTTNGTHTDFDGFFSLDISQGQELVFSYLGYKDMELPIYSSIMNVRMEEDAQALDEVVVTAMGTNRSETLGYAVSSVNTESTLQGRSAGIQIRGTKNLTNGSEPQLPLYVIDGKPLPDFTEGDLDENEIQSIEVLNSESAIELYGSKGSNGVIIIATRKSNVQDDITTTKFVIKKPYTILSDGDLTSIGISSFDLNAQYEYFAAPILNENVFLTARFTSWEQYNLLPGEASIYFAGSFAGKTTIDPYTTQKEMVVSLGIDPNITVTRKQKKNFKNKTFIGSNRILDRTYDLEVKNNKSVAVELSLLDGIPVSQNKEIKVEDIITNNASYDDKKGLLSWKIQLSSQETKTESFSFQVRYPKYKSISI